jgi:hypothetical protein
VVAIIGAVGWLLVRLWGAARRRPRRPPRIPDDQNR